MTEPDKYQPLIKGYAEESAGTLPTPAGGVSRLRTVTGPDYCEMSIAQDSGAIQYGRLGVKFGKATGDAFAVLGYRRCHDFDTTNGAGQDYAVVRANAQHIVGVVADGVSQSFYGDMASRHVSRFLIDFLWQCRATPPEQAELESQLHAQTDVLARDVETYPLSRTLPDMVRTALEVSRSRSGSQSVFGAFVLSLLSGELRLVQVGDIQATVFWPEGSKRIDSDPKGRWSTGGRSDLRLSFHILHNVTGVLLKSDGAATEWGRDGAETVGVDEFATMAEAQADRDDVSFLFAARTDGVYEPEPGIVPVERSRATVDDAIQAIATKRQEWQGTKPPPTSALRKGGEDERRGVRQRGTTESDARRSNQELLPAMPRARPVKEPVTGSSLLASVGLSPAIAASFLIGLLFGVLGTVACYELLVAPPRPMPVPKLPPARGKRAEVRIEGMPAANHWEAVLTEFRDELTLLQSGAARTVPIRISSRIASRVYVEFANPDGTDVVRLELQPAIEDGDVITLDAALPVRFLVSPLLLRVTDETGVVREEQTQLHAGKAYHIRIFEEP